MARFGGNRMIVGVLCVAQFVTVLDATIVTSALPRIGQELGFAPAGLQWVMTAYTLMFGGFLIAGGRVADLVGPRLMFIAGLAGFTATSLCCALASAPAALIVFRSLQGFTAAFLSPAALALLMSAAGTGARRRRVVGIWTAAAAGGGATGWVLGGLLVQYAGWRWVFGINVPIGVVTVLVGLMALPVVGRAADSNVDWVGSVGITLAALLLVYGLTEAAQRSAPAVTLAALAGAVGCGLATWFYERRIARHPLLPPRLLARRHIRAANLAATLLTGTTSPAMVLSVFYIQDLLQLSPGRAGLLFPAFNLTVIAGSLLGPRMISTTGPRQSATLGGLLLLAGAITLAALPDNGQHLAQLVTGFALMGSGLGIASVASTTVGSGAAPDNRGVASGLLNAAAQIGAAVGLAVLLPLAFSSSGTNLSRDGLRIGLTGVCAAAGLALLATRLLPPEDPIAGGEPRASTTPAENSTPVARNI